MFVVGVFTLGLFFTFPANSQERDFGQLAQRVVTTSVQRQAR
jgi:hypothetical protein